ncbi:hypothetical protein [Streptomyces sp. NPDC014734]|uniref:hypothetical protein n=1 Tax=Streptomyces sp. NPDC014734 TaxID=3364886 RepID=UPI0036F900C4
MADAVGGRMRQMPVADAWCRIERRSPSTGAAPAHYREQGSVIRRWIIWRNKHAADERLGPIAPAANDA